MATRRAVPRTVAAIGLFGAYWVQQGAFWTAVQATRAYSQVLPPPATPAPQPPADSRPVTDELRAFVAPELGAEAVKDWGNLGQLDRVKLFVEAVVHQLVDSRPLRVSDPSGWVYRRDVMGAVLHTRGLREAEAWLNLPTLPKRRLARIAVAEELKRALDPEIDWAAVASRSYDVTQRDSDAVERAQRKWTQAIIEAREQLGAPSEERPRGAFAGLPQADRELVTHLAELFPLTRTGAADPWSLPDIATLRGPISEAVGQLAQGKSSIDQRGLHAWLEATFRTWWSQILDAVFEERGREPDASKVALLADADRLLVSQLQRTVPPLPEVPPELRPFTRLTSGALVNLLNLPPTEIRQLTNSMRLQISLANEAQLATVGGAEVAQLVSDLTKGKSPEEAGAIRALHEASIEDSIQRVWRTQEAPLEDTFSKTGLRGLQSVLSSAALNAERIKHALELAEADPDWADLGHHERTERLFSYDAFNLANQARNFR
jgi:hypothetical protein